MYFATRCLLYPLTSSIFTSLSSFLRVLYIGFTSERVSFSSSTFFRWLSFRSISSFPNMISGSKIWYCRTEFVSISLQYPFSTKDFYLRNYAFSSPIESKSKEIIPINTAMGTSGLHLLSFLVALGQGGFWWGKFARNFVEEIPVPSVETVFLSIMKENWFSPQALKSYSWSLR